MLNLINEALVIGFITGLFGLIISTCMMYFFSKDFSLKKYNFWDSIFLSFFITGFLIHIFFEYMGLNKKFCLDRLKLK